MKSSIYKYKYRHRLTLVAMIFFALFCGVERVYGQTTTPWTTSGTGSNQKWYIYTGTTTNSNATGSSGNISIYTPNIAANCSIQCQATKDNSGKDGTDNQFYVKRGTSTTNLQSAWTDNQIHLSSDYQKNTTCTIAANSSLLEYGWNGTSSKSKTITVSIELPRHTDTLGTGSTAYTIPSGIHSVDVDFSQYFKSFYTTGAITAEIVNDGAHTDASCFSFDSGATNGKYPIASANSVYANSDCFTGGNGRCTIPTAIINFTCTTATTEKSAILRITHDNGTINIVLRGNVKQTPTFNWKINSMALGEASKLFSDVVVMSQSGATGSINLVETDQSGTPLSDDNKNFNIDNTNKILSLPEDATATTTYLKATFTSNNSTYKNADSITQFTISTSPLSDRTITWAADFTGLVYNSEATNTIDLSSAQYKATANPGGTNVDSYTVGDPTIASISGTTLTILKAGVTDITATKNADATYKKATMTKPLIVSSASSCNTALIDVQPNATSDYTCSRFTEKPIKVVWKVTYGSSASGPVYLQTDNGATNIDTITKANSGQTITTDVSAYQAQTSFKVTGLAKSGADKNKITLNSFAVYMASSFEKYDENPISCGSHDISTSTSGTYNIAKYKNLPGVITAAIVDVESGSNNTSDCFTFSDDSQGASITITKCAQAENTATATIKFTPKQVGDHKARLKISAYVDGSTVTYYIPITGTGTQTQSEPTLTFNKSDQTVPVFSTISGIEATSNSTSPIILSVITEYDDGTTSKKTASLANKTEAVGTSSCDMTINTRAYKSPGTEGVTKLVASVAATQAYTAKTCTLTITASKVQPTLTWSQSLPDPLVYNKTYTLNGYSHTYQTELTAAGTAPTVTFTPYNAGTTTEATSVEITGTSLKVKSGTGKIDIAATLSSTINSEAHTVTKQNINLGKASQTITWNLLSNSFAAGDKGQLDVTIKDGDGQTSELNASYASEATDVASVSSTGYMTCNASGLTKVTVSQSGNNNYSTATPESKVILVNLAEFGAELNQSDIKPFKVSTGSAFNVTSVPTGFKVSTDQSNWNTTLSNVANGTTIYVRFNPTANQTYNGNITITSTEGTFSVPVKGYVITEPKLTWTTNFNNISAYGTNCAQNVITLEATSSDSQGAITYSLDNSEDIATLSGNQLTIKQAGVSITVHATIATDPSTHHSSKTIDATFTATGESFKLKDDNGNPVTAITGITFSETAVGQVNATTKRVYFHSYCICSTLNVTSTNNEDFTVSDANKPASGTCGTDATLYYIEITFNPKSSHTHQSTITITGNGCSATIDVSGYGSEISFPDTYLQCQNPTEKQHLWPAGVGSGKVITPTGFEVKDPSEGTWGTSTNITDANPLHIRFNPQAFDPENGANLSGNVKIYNGTEATPSYKVWVRGVAKKIPTQIEWTVAEEEKIIAANSEFKLTATHTAPDGPSLTFNDIYYEIDDPSAFTIDNKADGQYLKATGSLGQTSIVRAKAPALSSDLYDPTTAEPVEYTFSITSGNFGETNIGQASEPQSIDLSTLYPGATSYTITSSNPYIFRAYTTAEATYSTATETTGSITTNSTNHNIYIKFYPETAGSVIANITVTPNTGSAVVIPVVGEGVQHTLAFGNKTIGDFSGHETFTLSHMVSAGGFTITSANENVFRLNGHAVSQVDINSGETFTVDFFPIVANTTVDFTDYYANSDNAITIYDKSTGKTYTLYNSGRANNREYTFDNTLEVGQSSAGYNIQISGLTNTSEFVVVTGDPNAYRVNGSTQEQTATNGTNYTITFAPQHKQTYDKFIYLHDNVSNVDYPILSAHGSCTTKASMTISWINGGNITANKGDLLYNLITNDKGFLLHPTYQVVSGTDYVEASSDGSYLVAKDNGSATISFTLSAEDQADYDYTHPGNANVTVTDLTAKYISWNQNLNYLKYDPSGQGTTADIELNAQVVDKTGAVITPTQAITYTLENVTNNCVTIITNGGKQYLHVTQTGTATLLIESPAVSGKYLKGEMRKSVRVTAYTGTCETITYLQSRTCQTTAKSFTDAFNIQRDGTTPPIKSVAYHINVDGGSDGFLGLFATTGSVALSFNGTGTEIRTVSVSGEIDNQSYEGTYTVTDADRYATQINVAVTEDYYDAFGLSYTMSVSDIAVTQASFFEQVTTSLNFGSTPAKKAVYQNVTVNFSALHNNIQAEIIDDNTGGAFSVKTEDLAIDNCEMFGQKTIQVAFSPNSVQANCSAKLKLTGSTDDGDVVFYVDLSGSATTRVQTLSWESIEQNITVDYKDRGTAIMLKAISDITYMKDGSTPDIVYTVPDGQDVVELFDSIGNKYIRILNTGGPVTITATQAGDDITTSATLHAYITVNAASQSILWDDIATLNVPTSTSQTDVTVTLDANSRDADSKATGLLITYSFTVTPVDGCGTVFADMFDTVRTANGNLELTYKGGGCCTIEVTASQAGNKNYTAATNKTKTINIVRINPTITWNTTELDNLCYGDQVTMTPTKGNAIGDNNFTYTSSDITNGNFVVTGSSLAVHNIVSNASISVKKNKDCWNNESASATTKSGINVSAAPQKIVWNQTLSDINAGNYSPATTINLNAYSTDTRHSLSPAGSGVNTWLTRDATTGEVTTGLSISYSVSFAPSGICQASDFQYTLSNGVLSITKAVNGKVTIKANCTDASGKYSAASEVEKSFNINLLTTNVSASVNGGSNLVYNPYGTYPITATATAGSFSFSNASDFTYEVTQGTDVISITSNEITTLKAGTAKVKVTKAGDCMIAGNYVVLDITVDQADRTLVWNHPASLTTASANVVLNAYTHDSHPTTLPDVGTYELSDETVITGTTLKCVELSGNNLMINGYGTAKLKVTFSGSDKYKTVDETWDITIANETLVITVTNPVDGTITSTDKDIDMWQYISASNYTGLTIDKTVTQPTGFDGVLTIASDNQHMTVYKEATTVVNVPCTIEVKTRYLSDGSHPKATGNITFNIAKGTLYFNVADGKWTDKSKWSRSDIYETHNTNEYNIEISKKCYIGNDPVIHDSQIDFFNSKVIAECHNLTISGDDAKLTLSENAVLDVKQVLTNSDAAKLLLKANYWGQSTVLFRNSSDDRPMATVEMYLLPASGNANDPLWQYRGIIVDGFAKGGGPWNCMSVYEWNEAYNGSTTDQGCWRNHQRGGDTGFSLSPWKGYAFANLCTEGEAAKEQWLTYTGRLINTTQHEFTLSRTETKMSDNVTLYANCGINLITNSYSAPMPINSIDFDTVEHKGSNNQTVTFYNAGTYSDWYSHSGSTKSDDRGDAGQLSVCPQKLSLSLQIEAVPSGQAFFVTANTDGSKVRFDYPDLYTYVNPSGRMFGPDLEIPFHNMLTINVEHKDERDRVILVECNSCSRKYDNGFDGLKMKGDDGLPHIYAYNKFGKTAVNTDSSFNKQYIGFEAGDDDVTYTLSFNTDHLYGYHSLFLTDRKLNETVDILAGETYSFKGYTIGEEMRFQINGITEEEWENRNNDDDDDDNNDLCDLRVVGNVLYIKDFTSGNYPATAIELYDVSGHLVWSTPLTSIRIYDLPDLPQGVYTIRLGDCFVKYSH